MKILMAIPTWNRGDYLDKAIAAIAAAREVTDACDVDLFISDNCSTDTTQAVGEAWAARCPWITYHRFDTHVTGWDQVIKRLFTQAPDGYDYMWIQGDDDILVQPTAFNQVAAAQAGAAAPPAIIHCTQARRALAEDQRVIAGTLGELLNQIGWIELLGWISSLVISRATIARTLESGHWQYAAASAFTHSELLLEAAYDEPALILGAGLIEPQDEAQTDACVERWAKAQIGQKYWMAIPNLMRLQANGRITRPLTVRFFRYHTFSLWDRFAIETIDAARILATHDEALEIKLSLLDQFAQLLGYGEDRKLYEDWLDAFSEEVWEVRRTLRKINDRLERCQRSSYDFPLLSVLRE